MASRKPARPKKEEKFNGQPMSHWYREADKLVMDCLVRSAFDLDDRSIIGRLARERLFHLANGINPVLCQEVIDERDRCRLGMAVIVNSFMLTPAERRAMDKKRKRAS